jgi:hypothetical protein
VDLGGVVIQEASIVGDTGLLGDEWLDTPEVEGAIEAIGRLRSGRFNSGVLIVSKAGPRVRERSRAWLDHVGFFGRTGVHRADLIFVRERRDKADVCRRRGVTHFLDNHLGVLLHLDTVPYRYLFTGGGTDVKRLDAVPAEISVTRSWTEAVALLDDDLGSYAS